MGRALRRALLLAAAAGCAAHAAPAAPPAARPSAAAVPAAIAQAPSCPRVERAKRMWSGFAVDVPSSAMHLALEVIVPIQERLGQVFCAPERARCRPSSLLSIELADADGSAAKLQLNTVEGEPPASFELVALGDEWQPEPLSLEAYLAACRAR